MRNKKKSSTKDLLHPTLPKTSKKNRGFPGWSRGPASPVRHINIDEYLKDKSQKWI